MRAIFAQSAHLTLLEGTPRDTNALLADAAPPLCTDVCTKLGAKWEFEALNPQTSVKSEKRPTKNGEKRGASGRNGGEKGARLVNCG